MFDGEVGAQAVAVVEEALAALDDIYERGWQPADLLHVARRSGDYDHTDLTAGLVLHHARCARAHERAPWEWVGQLRSAEEQHPRAAQVATGEQSPRALAARLLFEDPYHSVDEIRLLALTWRCAGSWQLLDDPPSRWPHHRVDDTSAAGRARSADPKLLNRIRGLLAKAEATDFAEEAETFTAKAQELMSRYSIGVAMLAGERGENPTVRARRIHLENPYVKEKVHLLSEIAAANRVRVVWADTLATATVVGTPVDLEQVDVLFTSLLLQATRAMQHSDAGSRKGSRTTSFRKAFLAGYAARIGQRLRDADTRATLEAADAARISVDDLLPVLADTSAAVDAEFQRLFPVTRAKRTGRSVDAEGWYAGRAAADEARLAAGG
ncbi:DUF2786 domain-containing protein [Rhodococcus triatomae]|uniref:Uncharacterized protein n=1 Tax=Rhodococcus triatomae TaxID=300028 RepID=A0A1G8A483_9NOCA|nr:DUF2786 domain-containing protein [Rhodococcus triatomae]QNG17864.1 DUF2786 domain-containing protein [Rhodococcus triatomae]QNG22468.1 DUF2786 domain-containing protein [Rhodococcus triatomae]SDH15671.1 Protein of unknown function [Rhodococcus triatomae]